jgi:hypothetical protein
MKFKKLGTLLLAAVATAGIGASARGVSINFTDGSDAQVVGVGQIASITVSGDDLQVNLTDGDPLTLPISSISSLSFTTTSGLSMNLAAGDELRMAIGATAITVAGLDAPAVLTIYGSNGAEVLSRKVDAGQSVSIAELPAGIYVANIESTTVKFLKK